MVRQGSLRSRGQEETPLLPTELEAPTESRSRWGKEGLVERTNMGNGRKRGQLCVKRKEIMDHHRVLFASGLFGA